MKSLALISFILLLTLILPAATYPPYAEPVLLTVCLFDRCGGCGSDNPGCGECKDAYRVHDIIKRQLGDRLYDGAIVYRILNCRYTENAAVCGKRGELYGVPPELLALLPITYIGTDDTGLYLPGENMLSYIKEMLDRYINGDDLGVIQADITRIYEPSKISTVDHSLREQHVLQTQSRILQGNLQ
jgi:hypothetical protein